MASNGPPNYYDMPPEKWLEWATAQVATLTAERDALLADKARLDWWEANILFRGERMLVRDAIDAQMARGATP